ncbi:MOSC domain containing protein [Nitzschia inconspicua]|uniref:MOSC domain containing protein n=1 Tax=Nitzschia inconspicua TaxID=303405 RepID=A0A9K3LYZ5_9STRA|nr:MOSC domain containing protein [Nitzschia inconspicua]
MSMFLPSWIDMPTMVVGSVIFLLLSKSMVSLLVTTIHKAASTVHLRYLLWQQQEDDGTIVGTVSALYIHPVKSMRAVALEKSHLDAKGLVDDRRFMVVYEVPLPVHKKKWDTGDIRYRFLTQRQCPSLATITAKITNTTLTLEAPAVDAAKKSTDRIEISLDVRSQSSVSQIPTQFLAGIWDDTILVQDMGDHAAAFLQAVVNADTQSTMNGCRVRLVRHSINDRAADPTFTPQYAKTWWGASPLVSLTDGYPILVASEASLQDVNDKLKQAGKDTIPMSRFRPNIVVKGDNNNLNAFEEDRWKVIAIGTVLFAIVKACPRCKQSCTDQITGQVTEEPVGIMKSFRALGDHASDNVFFAQNAIALVGLGKMESIQVGDPVRVLKRGDPIYK